MKKMTLWQFRIGILLVLAAFLAVGAASSLAGAAGVTHLSGPHKQDKKVGAHQQHGKSTAHLKGTISKQLTMRSQLSTPTALTLTPTTTSVVCTNTKVTSANYSTAKGKFSEYTVPNSGYPYESNLLKGTDGAVWFADYENDAIARVASNGVFTECATPTASEVYYLTNGPDGAIWFTEENTHIVGRLVITTSGVAESIAHVTEFYSASLGEPEGIVTGPDGNLWFTDYSNNTIDKIDTNGIGTSYAGLTSGADLYGITVGPDKALWFTEYGLDQIGRITTHGDVLEFGGLTSGAEPWNITVGPDKNLWFTEYGTASIGRLTPQGYVTEFGNLKTGAEPSFIINLGDGTLAFTEYNDVIGRITTSGTVTEIVIPNGSETVGITTTSKGVIWFGDYDASFIGKLTLK